MYSGRLDAVGQAEKGSAKKSPCIQLHDIQNTVNHGLAPGPCTLKQQIETMLKR